jgi:hypothetical protein
MFFKSFLASAWPAIMALMSMVFAALETLVAAKACKFKVFFGTHKFSS